MNAKKILKYLFIGLASLLLSVVLYLGLAYVLARITVNNNTKNTPQVAIYIQTNGVHTDIVVPIKNELFDWTTQIKKEHTLATSNNAQFLAMGWGDKGFYLETPTWADLKASVAFKAAFGLSTTAIHATFYTKMKENESCKKIMISSNQYSKLVGFMKDSFQKDSKGNFINIKTTANYGNTDAFYEAKGSYSMIHTCNTWANNALKSCNQKACLWTPFDTGIFLKYTN